jgi:hypothetical protein
LASDRAIEIAERIAHDTEQEFKHARAEVELPTNGDEGEVDAYIWLETQAAGEDVEDLWSFVRFACTQAWENDDVRIVWRWKRNRAGTLEHDDEG